MAKRKMTAPPAWYADLWPEIEATLGANAYAALRFLVPAEREVGDWLASHSRQPAEPLRPEDLAGVLAETQVGFMSARFASALLAARIGATPTGPWISSTGEILIDSDAPVSRRLPELAKVRRVTTSTTRTAEKALRDLARALTRQSVDVPPATSAMAVLAAIDSTRALGMAGPKRKPATNAEIAEALGLSGDVPKETLRQLVKRERRKVSASRTARGSKVRRPK